MDDYIKREDAINTVRNTFTGMTADTLELRINDIPSADVAPVVRCKDCEWWTKQEKSIQGRCALNGTYPTGGWYCANGRKERQ